MKLNPDVEKKFKELFRDVKIAPSYSLLEESVTPEDEEDENFTTFESKIEELVWQGFIYGLRVSREHEVIFKATCSHCLLNSITETADGEIITHDLAKEDGWIWDFDNQQWVCPDCERHVTGDLVNLEGQPNG